MKKFFKFVFGVVALAVAIGGAYYAYKKFICGDCSKDDFDDDFEDDAEDDAEKDAEDREYVSLDLGSDQAAKETEEPQETTEENQ